MYGCVSLGVVVLAGSASDGVCEAPLPQRSR